MEPDADRTDAPDATRQRRQDRVEREAGERGGGDRSRDAAFTATQERPGTVAERLEYDRQVPDDDLRLLDALERDLADADADTLFDTVSPANVENAATGAALAGDSPADEQLRRESFSEFFGDERTRGDEDTSFFADTGTDSDVFELEDTRTDTRLDEAVRLDEDTDTLFDTRQDTRTDTRQDVDTRQDTRQDTRLDFRFDLRQDTRQDLRQDTRQDYDSRQDFRFDAELGPGDDESDGFLLSTSLSEDVFDTGVVNDADRGLDLFGGGGSGGGSSSSDPFDAGDPFGSASDPFGDSGGSSNSDPLEGFDDLL
jgi:hypothetical protein